MNATGLRPMLAVQWRTHRRGTLVWMIVLIASMVGTAGSIAGLYSTPEKIHSYAQAATAGDALVVINGRVEGIDSLGGVIADEFGFLAAFLLPLLGISLVAQATRSEEEAGRLETVLAGRVARHVPVLAGLIVAAAAILVTAIGFAIGLTAFGVPATRSVLYAASLGALALVFAGLAALLAQVTLHSRGVYTWGLLILAVAYVLRGAGDAMKTWITWLSPLGWAEKAAPFGDMRWWTLLIPLLVGGLLAALAVILARRRDLGSALIRGGAGPASASRWLRSPLGLAVSIHRPAFLGWLAGNVILAGLMGALAKQFIDAVLGNPAMAEALGVSSGQPADAMIALTQLYIAVIATAYAVQAVGSLRGEETAGRLEARLSGTLSRTWWLVAHAFVISLGLVAMVLVSSVVLATGTAWSMGSAADFGRIIAAGVAYLPAELLVGGLALALFGVWPTGLPAAWAATAFVAFIAFLGPGLNLPKWLLDLSPTTHIGNPPLGTVDGTSLAVLGGIAAVLGIAAAIGFRHRGVPQH
jgi:ABC-2 type transport system permease protein